ncbi:MAG TPA: hypothetical protein VM146_12595 [Steroidobacteraceae bacterium]|nr:hypothetical protein [Steroidobacteraceae bacterium]
MPMRAGHPRRQLLLAACAIAAGTAAFSRPVVIEESQWLEAPRSDLTFLGESLAIEGDRAIATALRSKDRTYEYPYQQLALLYRRSGNTWVFDRVLVDDTVDARSFNDPEVAIKDGLASVSTSPLRMFRRTGDDDWVSLTQPFTAAVGNAAWANGPTRIDGRTVSALAGRCNHTVISTDLVGAAWSAPQLLIGNARVCTLANNAAALDVEDNRLVFTNPQEDSTFPPSETRIYERTAPGAPWRLAETLAAGEFGFGVALHGEDVLLGSWNPLGNDVYRKSAQGWTHVGTLPTLRGYDKFYAGATHIGENDQYVLVGTSLFDERPGGISVYRKDADGRYRHVAQLVSSEGDSLGPVAEISGRTVAVSGWARDSFDHGRLYFFELPEEIEAPPVLQDNFEDGNADGWSFPSGTMTVERRGPSRVLRQAEAADATGVLAASNTSNESVQADVRPTAFDETTSWFGLATRFSNSNNYYAAALVRDGVVELRRVQAGRVVTVASSRLAVSAGRRYHLRLESIGSNHRVYVNGARVIDALDAKLVSGRIAVLTRGAAAEFDNVVVTPNHRTPLYEADIPNGGACEEFVREQNLRQSGTPAWDCTNFEAGYIRQASLENVARAAIGPVTDDQVIESRMQLEDFAVEGSQDKWFGVMTRYSDENNYYYFSLRSSKSMSLRKLVNGEIVELDSAGFTLNVSDWHTMKLEAIGNHIRAYIDGQLLMEAEDSSHPVGISGIVTYRTSALFDYLRVIQP